MKKAKMPIGIDNFAKVIKKGYYYVDKSTLIAKILDSASEATLFTRPRRFGKTLSMNMLCEFFDIRKDSQELFKNLQIAKYTELCKENMNKYPTVFITFKDVSGLDFEGALYVLKDKIAEIYRDYRYIMQSDIFTEDDREIFLQMTKLTEWKNCIGLLKKSLSFITQVLEKYYNKSVVLLIDEYDVPIAKAEEKGYYNEMIDVIRGMLSQALKGNNSLNFAVITGCLKIAKESIFTGLNNLAVDTVMSLRYDEYFGFTEREVKKMLSDTELDNHFDDIKEWYDGYKFGKTDVYCPWDVVNYVQDLMTDESIKPQAYWNNTSGNSIIRTFVDKYKDFISGDFEKLMCGEYILKEISDSLTYNLLYSSEDNIWSVMYFTGYLTRAESFDADDDEHIALKIPNKEVMKVFETTLSLWFKDYVKNCDTSTLTSAIWNKQSDIAMAEITKLLYQTISYYDYREDFYHAFLAGIFTGAGYYVKSNREMGEGRSDIVVKNQKDGKIAVFEIKRSRDISYLQKDCKEALKQIQDRKYAEEYTYLSGIDVIYCGISFYKKQCKIIIE